MNNVWNICKPPCPSGAEEKITEYAKSFTWTKPTPKVIANNSVVSAQPKMQTHVISSDTNCDTIAQDSVDSFQWKNDIPNGKNDHHDYSSILNLQTTNQSNHSHNSQSSMTSSEYNQERYHSRKQMDDDEPLSLSEYQCAYAWPSKEVYEAQSPTSLPGHVSRIETFTGKKLETFTGKKSETFTGKKSATFTGRKSATFNNFQDIQKQDNLNGNVTKESNGFGETRMKKKTEYHAKFRPFSDFVYVIGNGFKKPEELDRLSHENDKAKNWFSEVEERSEQAKKYRSRSQLGHPIAGQLEEIYSQRSLWDNYHPDRNLAALSLATTQKIIEEKKQERSLRALISPQRPAAPRFISSAPSSLRPDINNHLNTNQTSRQRGVKQQNVDSNLRRKRDLSAPARPRPTPKITEKNEKPTGRIWMNVKKTETGLKAKETGSKAKETDSKTKENVKVNTDKPNNRLLKTQRPNSLANGNSTVEKRIVKQNPSKTSKIEKSKKDSLDITSPSRSLSPDSLEVDLIKAKSAARPVKRPPAVNKDKEAEKKNISAPDQSGKIWIKPLGNSTKIQTEESFKNNNEIKNEYDKKDDKEDDKEDDKKDDKKDDNKNDIKLTEKDESQKEIEKTEPKFRKESLKEKDLQSELFDAELDKNKLNKNKNLLDLNSKLENEKQETIKKDEKKIEIIEKEINKDFDLAKESCKSDEVVHKEIVQEKSQQLNDYEENEFTKPENDKIGVENGKIENDKIENDKQKVKSDVELIQSEMKYDDKELNDSKLETKGCETNLTNFSVPKDIKEKDFSDNSKYEHVNTNLEVDVGIRKQSKGDILSEHPKDESDDEEALNFGSCDKKSYFDIKDSHDMVLDNQFGLVSDQFVEGKVQTQSKHQLAYDDVENDKHIFESTQHFEEKFVVEDQLEKSNDKNEENFHYNYDHTKLEQIKEDNQSELLKDKLNGKEDNNNKEIKSDLLFKNDATEIKMEKEDEKMTHEFNDKIDFESDKMSHSSETSLHKGFEKEETKQDLIKESHFEVTKPQFDVVESDDDMKESQFDVESDDERTKPQFDVAKSNDEKTKPQFDVFESDDETKQHNKYEKYDFEETKAQFTGFQTNVDEIKYQSYESKLNDETKSELGLSNSDVEDIKPHLEIDKSNIDNDKPQFDVHELHVEDSKNKFEVEETKSQFEEIKSKCEEKKPEFDVQKSFEETKHKEFEEISNKSNYQPESQEISLKGNQDSEFEKEKFETESFSVDSNIKNDSKQEMFISCSAENVDSNINQERKINYDSDSSSDDSSDQDIHEDIHLNKEIQHETEFNNINEDFYLKNNEMKTSNLDINTNDLKSNSVNESNLKSDELDFTFENKANVMSDSSLKYEVKEHETEWNANLLKDDHYEVNYLDSAKMEFETEKIKDDTPKSSTENLSLIKEEPDYYLTKFDQPNKFIEDQSFNSNKMDMKFSDVSYDVDFESTEEVKLDFAKDTEFNNNIKSEEEISMKIEKENVEKSNNVESNNVESNSVENNNVENDNVESTKKEFQFDGFAKETVEKEESNELNQELKKDDLLVYKSSEQVKDEIKFENEIKSDKFEEKFESDSKTNNNEKELEVSLIKREIESKEIDSQLNFQSEVVYQSKHDEMPTKVFDEKITEIKNESFDFEANKKESQIALKEKQTGNFEIEERKQIEIEERKQIEIESDSSDSDSDSTTDDDSQDEYDINAKLSNTETQLTQKNVIQNINLTQVMTEKDQFKDDNEMFQIESHAKSEIAKSEIAKLDDEKKSDIKMDLFDQVKSEMKQNTEFKGETSKIGIENEPKVETHFASQTTEGNKMDSSAKFKYSISSESITSFESSSDSSDDESDKKEKVVIKEPEVEVKPSSKNDFEDQLGPLSI